MHKYSVKPTQSTNYQAKKSLNTQRQTAQSELSNTHSNNAKSIIGMVNSKNPLTTYLPHSSNLYTVCTYVIQ